MSVFIAFWRGRDNIEGPVFGPFDYVEATYEEIRVSPDGNFTVAYLSDGEWRLGPDTGPFAGGIYSDFVVSSSNVTSWTDDDVARARNHYDEDGNFTYCEPAPSPDAKCKVPVLAATPRRPKE